MTSKLEISKVVPPEDLRPGDYVCPHACVLEWPRCEESLPGQPVLQRASFIPFGTPEPRRVVAVCLPFVLTRGPDGSHRTLDVRRTPLARLTAAFGRKAFKKLGKKEAAGWSE